MTEEENKKLEEKLSRVSNPELKDLVENAKRIREELGDNPEIKNIELDIVNAQSMYKKLNFVEGAKFLFGLACFGVSFYSVINNNKFNDLSCIMLLIVGTGLISTAESGVYSGAKMSASINKIQSRINNLRLIEENKLLKQQLHDANFNLIEKANNSSGKQYVKRR